MSVYTTTVYGSGQQLYSNWYMKGTSGSTQSYKSDGPYSHDSTIDFDLSFLEGATTVSSAVVTWNTNTTPYTFGGSGPEKGRVYKTNSTSSDYVSADTNTITLDPSYVLSNAGQTMQLATSFCVVDFGGGLYNDSSHGRTMDGWNYQYLIFTQVQLTITYDGNPPRGAAGGLWIGDENNLARYSKNLWVGVDNVARKVISAWVGDENGIARHFYPAMSAKTLPIGALVYFKELSGDIEYSAWRVVDRDIYFADETSDTHIAGTVLMKEGVLSGSAVAYSSSTSKAYYQSQTLDNSYTDTGASAYLTIMNPVLSNILVNVWIPSASNVPTTLPKRIQRKVFAPSITELKGEVGGYTFANEGSWFQYFQDNDRNKLIRYRNGTATNYGTRTGSNSGTPVIGTNGGYSTLAVTYTNYRCPVICIQNNAIFVEYSDGYKLAIQ